MRGLEEDEVSSGSVPDLTARTQSGLSSNSSNDLIYYGIQDGRLFELIEGGNLVVTRDFKNEDLDADSTSPIRLENIETSTSSSLNWSAISGDLWEDSSSPVVYDGIVSPLDINPETRN